MPKQKFHYYTIRNVLTGEPTQVRAKNQAQGARGFFDRRFTIELTTQEDLVKFARAGVVELDLTDGSKGVKQRIVAQPQMTGTVSARAHPFPWGAQPDPADMAGQPFGCALDGGCVRADCNAQGRCMNGLVAIVT